MKKMRKTQPGRTDPEAVNDVALGDAMSLILKSGDCIFLRLGLTSKEMSMENAADGVNTFYSRSTVIS